MPGYGAADAIQQGFDGWLGVYNLWLRQITHDVLAHTMSLMDRSDRPLIMTAAEANTGLPGFRRGRLASRPTNCAQSSTVLHAILKDVPTINRVFGHSKGAVAINNALQSLPRDTTRRLHVVTFGWAMPEDIPTASYSQFLGRIDWLGRAHSWGHPSPTLIPTHHGTNTSIPLSMPVSVLARLAMMEHGAAATRDPVPAGATTTPQYNRVAGQWNEEDSKTLLARIQLDEGAHANAAD